MYDYVTSGELASEFPSVFTVCIVTWAQARKFGDSIDISDNFLAAEDQVKGEVHIVQPELSDPESLPATSGAEL